MKNRGDTLELKTDDGLYGEFLVYKLTLKFRSLEVRFKICDKFVSFFQMIIQNIVEYSTVYC